MNRPAVFLAMSAALGMLSGCGATGPRHDYAPPALGAHWDSIQRDTGSFGSGESRVRVTRTEREWKGQRLIALSSSRSVSLLDPRDSGLVAVLAGDGRVLSSFEPRWSFAFPMEVGRSWRSGYRLTVGERSYPYQVDCKVSEFGPVQTVDGGVPAFRIDCRNSIDTTEVFWFSPERNLNVKVRQIRGPASPFGPGTREVEMVDYRSPPQ